MGTTLFDVVRSHPDVIGHIQKSVYNTLKIYARAEIVPKPHFFRSNAEGSEITVIGMLDLTQDGKTSVLSIGFSDAVFVNVYENMFQEKLTEISLETADLAGELINIIFQTIDPVLADLGLRFQASLPRVIALSNLDEWVRTSTNQSLVLPFSTGYGDIYFEVFESEG